MTMDRKEIEYVLTMNSEQAREVRKAVEFLMRMKLAQFDQIPYNVLDIGMGDYCKRRDAAEPHLRWLEKELFPTWADVKKDDEWYRLYNLYQVIRYQIYLAESPLSDGVDSYPPMQITDEPMPKCEWRKKE